MYDFPVRTTQLASSEAVHINFNTVEQFNEQPRLVVYDIYIYGDGSVQILQQGQPTPAGKIVAAVGFGPSPNSATPHVMAELQVPMSVGPPSAYSSDPLYWNATLPPTTTPPDPCQTQTENAFSNCTKNNASQVSISLYDLSTAFNVVATSCFVSTVCAPLSIPLGLLGADLRLLSLDLAEIAGDPPGFIITVPPDSDYAVLAQPATYSFSLPTQGVPLDEAAALNAWYEAIESAIALGQAEIASVGRAEGASLAGDSTWVTKQIQAAQSFGAQLGTVLSTLPALQASVSAAFEANGFHPIIIESQVSAFLSDINPTSPTTPTQSEFYQTENTLTEFGATSRDLALMTQLLLSTDPNAVAALGNGVFPVALSDPTLATGMTELAGSLEQNLPSQTSLTPSFRVTLPGDYMATGVGLRGQTAANVNVIGIPAGATVVKAFLYWGMLDNGAEPALGQLSVNGTPITGSLIGSGPDTCWGDSYSFTYRAIVTPLVAGNGTYALSGVAAGGSILGEGASLVIIYRLPGAPVKTIMLDDGNLSMPYGTERGSAAFSGFTATALLSAATTFMVGDGQETEFGVQTPTSFSGAAGTINFPNLFGSLDGPLWDTATFDVSSAVAPGTSPNSANISIAGDCLLWSAQAFSVTSTPVTTPVIATSAFVNASSNGNTVVRPEALTADGAPTLEQQLQDVVQYRIIQNRGLAALTLLNQLLNGLVADGVIDDQQASSMQASILGNVVTPPVSQVCDVNGDGQIDKNDIALITSALNTPASGPGDPRDANHDGIVNLLDARICVTKCTYAGCVVR